RLPEYLADFRGPAFRQKHLPAAGPALVVLLVLLDELLYHGVHREAVAREADAEGRDLAEAHRAEIIERRDPRVGRGGHHAALHSGRYLARVLLHEVIRRDRFRPHTQPVDAGHLAVLRRVDDLWRDAGEIHLVGLQHVDRDTGGDPGVDRV